VAEIVKSARALNLFGAAAMMKSGRQYLIFLRVPQ
jgi:hypothetical protein